MADDNATDVARWATCHVTLQRFMVRDLQLAGSELMAFAVIHGFCHTGEWRHVPRSYLAFWMGCDPSTVSRALASLEGRGLIRRGFRRRGDGLRETTVRLTSLALHPANQTAPDACSDNGTITLHGFMGGAGLGLSGLDLIVFGELCELCQAGQSCQVPLSYLRSWTGASESTVRRSVRRLEGSGLVMRRTLVRGDRTTYNEYALGPRAAEMASMLASALAAKAPEEEATPPAGEAADDAGRTLERDFQALRTHVPSTRGFDYGRDAYRALRGRFSHDQIVAACDDRTARLRAEDPSREERYYPHCERFLTDVGREMEANTTRMASVRAARRQPETTAELVRAAMRLDLSGPLGGEAYRLNDRVVSAREGTPEKAEARQALRLWCQRNAEAIRDLVRAS